MSDVLGNPVGTDGFEFVEFAAPDPDGLGEKFEALGFVMVGRHRSKDIRLYRQGGVNFLINAQPGSFAQNFADQHGPSICAMGFRVQDAPAAYAKLVGKGAWGVPSGSGPMELNIPAIKGIGDSLIYLVDRWHGKNGAKMGDMGDISIYDVDFVGVRTASGRLVDAHPTGAGLEAIDHVTHNVHRGCMREWAGFYERLFGFKQSKYFDIEGKLTGLKSMAMVSPCGKIRIPINESSDGKSQIAEFLDAYRGEGIQHVALSTGDIYSSVEDMAERGAPFQSTLGAYYDAVDGRLPGHGEPLEELRRLGILIDGATHFGDPGGLLLQIFTKEWVGPIFFEVIERKGNDGFGEGNFKALFESIELDQIRRGVLGGVEALGGSHE